MAYVRLTLTRKLSPSFAKVEIPIGDIVKIALSSVKDSRGAGSVLIALGQATDNAGKELDDG